VTDKTRPDGKPIVETKTITTNTVEGFYSIFKRGMKGIYQHCKEKHLHRYLSEFDFRYSNRVALGVDDQDRADKALKGIAGKRLTYRSPLINSCRASKEKPWRHPRFNARAEQKACETSGRCSPSVTSTSW
jgi:hypothetical protein